MEEGGLIVSAIATARWGGFDGRNARAVSAVNRRTAAAAAAVKTFADAAHTATRSARPHEAMTSSETGAGPRLTKDG